jgi:hypothetical protein
VLLGPGPLGAALGVLVLDPVPLAAAPDVLLLELDCVLVHAPIVTAMTRAPVAMKPVSVRDGIGELLLSVAYSDSAGHRSGCVHGEVDQLLGQHRRSSNLVVDSSRSRIRLALRLPVGHRR